MVFNCIQFAPAAVVDDATGSSPRVWGTVNENDLELRRLIINSDNIADKLENVFYLSAHSPMSSNSSVTLPYLTLLLIAGNDYVTAVDSMHKAQAHRQQKRLKTTAITDFEDAWTANSEMALYRHGSFENLTFG